MIPRRCTSDVISRMVQREFPVGGGPHTSATTAACAALSSIGPGPGWRSSLSANDSPPSAYRRATRVTSRVYPPTALAVARSDIPLARCSTVVSLRQVRALCMRPPAFIRRNSARSLAVTFSFVKRLGFFTHRLDQTSIRAARAGVITPARSRH